jgi:hypothetical protein
LLAHGPAVCRAQRMSTRIPSRAGAALRDCAGPSRRRGRSRNRSSWRDEEAPGSLPGPRGVLEPAPIDAVVHPRDERGPPPSMAALGERQPVPRWKGSGIVDAARVAARVHDEGGWHESRFSAACPVVGVRGFPGPWQPTPPWASSPSLGIGCHDDPPPCAGPRRRSKHECRSVGTMDPGVSRPREEVS